MFCSACGNEFINKSKICINCGLSIDEVNNDDANIESVRIKDHHLYIGDKWNNYYAKVFHNIEQGKGANWNTGAAIFTFVWMLYRKLWLPAIVYYILSYVVSTFLMLSGSEPIIIIGIALLFILPGFYANKLVYYKAQKIICKSKDILPEARSNFIMNKGGTSTVAAWILGIFIVVAFIGIIAAVAIPAYQTYIDKAKMTAEQGTNSNVQ